MGLEGVEVAAQGLGVLALLEDREPIAAGMTRLLAEDRQRSTGDGAEANGKARKKRKKKSG